MIDLAPFLFAAIQFYSLVLSSSVRFTPAVDKRTFNSMQRIPISSYVSRSLFFPLITYSPAILKKQLQNPLQCLAYQAYGHLLNHQTHCCIVFPIALSGGKVYQLSDTSLFALQLLNTNNGQRFFPPHIPALQVF